MPTVAESDLKVGERVVYPNQGVCRVVGITEMTIAGQKQAFIKLAREEDGATVMVPKGRVEKVGVRRVADTAELKKVFTFLAAPVEGPELDWKVRARTHGERMTEGGLMGLAQVVKGLVILADLRPLPPKERELYDNARHLLVSEIAASLELPPVSAEDAVDLALYPPGVERKKPDLAALALAAGDDDELGLGLEDVGLGDEGEEAEEEEAAEGGEETEAAEGDEEEAEEAAPKKRGRPPKPKPEGAVEGEVPVKRPRGRPRKNPLPEAAPAAPPVAPPAPVAAAPVAKAAAKPEPEPKPEPKKKAAPAKPAAKEKAAPKAKAKPAAKEKPAPKAKAKPKKK